MSDNEECEAAGAFWKHVKQSKLYELERAKVIKIEQLRDEYIALSHIALKSFLHVNNDSGYTSDALSKFKEYSDAVQGKDDE